MIKKLFEEIQELEKNRKDEKDWLTTPIWEKIKKLSKRLKKYNFEISYSMFSDNLILGYVDEKSSILLFPTRTIKDVKFFLKDVNANEIIKIGEYDLAKAKPLTKSQIERIKKSIKAFKEVKKELKGDKNE